MKHKPLGQEALAKSVVDLMGSGVRQILAFEPHPCSSTLLCKDQSETYKQSELGG